MQNRNKYIIFWLIGFLSIVIPVVIYNGINHQIFKQISAMELTFTTLLGFSLIGIAALLKVKSRTGIYMIFIGVLLTLLSEASKQIGLSLLLMGAGMMIDKLIWSRLAIFYKVKWYVQTGRKIVYTKSIE